MEGKVIKKISDYEFVIDLGLENGINENDRLILFNVGEEIINEETKENLGKLELLCGHVKVKHVQAKMSTVESNEYSHKTIRKKSPFASAFPPVFPSYYYDSNDEEETVSKMLSIEDVEPYKTFCRKID